MSRFAFLITYLFLFGVAAAQPADTVARKPLRLIYYVDETPGNTSFLIPFIETYLRDLRYSDQNLGRVYSEVMSLNQLNENRKLEGKVIDEFVHADRKQTTLTNSPARDSNDAMIARNLLRYDAFLVIKIHPLNSLLEYQFFMYNVLKSTDPKIKDTPILQDYRSSSVFIDPQSSHHRDDLVFALKQVCAEVNQTPKAQIRVNKRIPKSIADTFYVALYDTLYLEAVAIDPDSPKERFVYTWTVSDKAFYGQISYGKETQAIVIDTPAVLSIGLSISDGITQSQRTDITIKAIHRPTVQVFDGGNAYFILDPEADILSNDPNDIRDDRPGEQYEYYDFLFRRYLFGNKEFLYGEDSLVIYNSSGALHIGRTNIPDSLVESTIHTREIARDTSVYNIPEDTSSSEILFSKGKYSTITYFPGNHLHVSKYVYTFYAEENGVRSNNLNVAVRFGKIRAISLWAEPAIVTLGFKKGFMGMAYLGANWFPFRWLQFSCAATYSFGPSKYVRNREGEKLETGRVNSLFIFNFVKHKGHSLNSFSLELQRFDVATPSGIRKDNLWGIGWRQSVSFLFLGIPFGINGGYHYYPNLGRKSYISGVGMFSMSFGIRYEFVKRRK